MIPYSLCLSSRYLDRSKIEFIRRVDIFNVFFVPLSQPPAIIHYMLHYFEQEFNGKFRLEYWHCVGTKAMTKHRHQLNRAHLRLGSFRSRIPFNFVKRQMDFTCRHQNRSHYWIAGKKRIISHCWRSLFGIKTKNSPYLALIRCAKSQMRPVLSI